MPSSISVLIQRSNRGHPRATLAIQRTRKKAQAVAAPMEYDVGAYRSNMFDLVALAFFAVLIFFPVS